MFVWWENKSLHYCGLFCYILCKLVVLCLHTLCVDESTGYSPKKMLDALFCIISPHFLEMMSLHLELGWWAARPSHPPVSTFHWSGLTVGVQPTHTQLSIWVLGYQVLLLPHQKFLPTKAFVHYQYSLYVFHKISTFNFIIQFSPY